LLIPRADKIIKTRKLPLLSAQSNLMEMS
jgi:hypothetical protein